MATEPAGMSLHFRKIAAFAAYVRGRLGYRCLIAIGLLVCASVAEGLSILLLVPILRLLGPDSTSISIGLPGSILGGNFGQEIRVGLGIVLVAWVLIVLCQSVIVAIKNLYFARLLYDVINDLRIKVFRSIVATEWSFLSAARISELHHTLTADIERVHSALFNLFLFIQAMVVMLVYLGVSFLISVPVTLITIAVGAIAFALLEPVRRSAANYGYLLTGNRKEQYQVVSEFLAGMKVAKSFNAENGYLAQHAAILGKMREDFVRYSKITSLGSLVFQAFSAAALASFVYGCILVFSLPLPRLVVLVYVFFRILPRLSVLQGNIQEILVNLPAFEAIEHVRLASESAAEEDPGSSSNFVLPIRQEIRFSRVSYRYAEGNNSDVVSEASFVVPAKQVTALVGPSGSGKSTIADMMMGLLPVGDGIVTVDGRVLDNASRRAWRMGVAYVPQDVFLLHDTISANLRIAAPDATEPAMWECLEMAHAKGFVERLPDRLDTVVGNRGARLSGGERQRLALARALLRRPQLLILDEATSALDWESQAQIASSIGQLRDSMTVVTIAHRLSMISFADWIVAFENGKVVETGRYEELITLSDSHLSRLVSGEGFSGGVNKHVIDREHL